MSDKPVRDIMLAEAERDCLVIALEIRMEDILARENLALMTRLEVTDRLRALHERLGELDYAD